MSAKTDSHDSCATLSPNVEHILLSEDIFKSPISGRRRQSGRIV